MTRIKIKTLVWDEWNIEHIKKHKVKIEEIAEAGENLFFHRKTKKGRYLVVGKSRRRLITLILNRKDTGKYYLVTAFDSAKKDRRKIKIYEKKNKK